MTMDLTRWLLRTTRSILPPLAWSIVMRIVGLAAGGALLGLAVAGLSDVSRGVRTVGWLATTLVAISLLKATARYLEQYAGHYVAFASLAHLRVLLFDRLEPQAPAAIEGRRTGDVLSRATRDVDRVEVFFAHTLGPALTAVVVPAGGVIWLHWYAGALTAAVAGAGWVSLIAIATLGHRSSTAASHSLRRLRGDLAQHITDTVQGVSEVVAFGAVDRRLAEMDTQGAEIAAAQRQRARSASLRRGLTLGVSGALPALVIGAAIESVGARDALVAAAVVLGLTPAALAVEEFAAELDQAFASAARLREITEATPATPEPVAPRSVPAGPVEVVLDDVSFAYPGARATPVLENVSITVPAGAKVALVGASGSGKSTVGALVARLRDPQDGRVLLGGVDTRDLADAELRSTVTLVAQRPYLFRGTLKDNLLVAAPDADDATLAAACAAAQLDSTLSALPRGWDSPVGEHGSRLSGGERQRLALARALLRDPRVLVLDEVTSELDRATEASLGEALTAVAKDRTVLVIAHRLASIVDADQIVVLDAGKVVETGTHSTLLASGGAYARLWSRQGAASHA